MLITKYKSRCLSLPRPHGSLSLPRPCNDKAPEMQLTNENTSTLSRKPSRRKIFVVIYHRSVLCPDTRFCPRKILSLVYDTAKRLSSSTSSSEEPTSTSSTRDCTRSRTSSRSQQPSITTRLPCQNQKPLYLIPTTCRATTCRAGSVQHLIIGHYTSRTNVRWSMSGVTNHAENAKR